MIKVKWPKVLDYNDVDRPPLIAWIDLCNGTMFRIFAFFSHGGKMRPRDGLIFGIERVGSFMFALNNEMSWDYVAGKLQIPEPDARNLADWLNVQLGHDVKQQGDYEQTYINGSEPYGLIGERWFMPLVPEVIE